MIYKPSGLPLSLITPSPYHHSFSSPPQSSPFPQLLVHHAPGEYQHPSADKSYRVLLFRSLRCTFQLTINHRLTVDTYQLGKFKDTKLFEMRQKFIVMFYRLTETETGIKNNVLHTQIT